MNIYDEAENYYKLSLEISEKNCKIDNLAITTIECLAGLYESNGKFDEAESLYKRSLEIREKTLGSDDPSVATPVYNLAEIYKGLVP